MADKLTITIDDAAVQAAFKRLRDFGQDASPMFAEIAEHLLESTQRRFATSTAPSGIPWAPLRDGSGRRPLLKSGTLRDQIVPAHGKDYAEIVATSAYARWHQEGTKPFVILPKKGKALSFGPRMSLISGPSKGRVVGSITVRKVNHPGLPARPFIGLSDQDYVDIRKIAGAYLEDLAEG
jgi:phage virion morphogenesis protein